MAAVRTKIIDQPPFIDDNEVQGGKPIKGSTFLKAANIYNYLRYHQGIVVPFTTGPRQVTENDIQFVVPPLRKTKDFNRRICVMIGYTSGSSIPTSDSGGKAQFTYSSWVLVGSKSTRTVYPASHIRDVPGISTNILRDLNSDKMVYLQGILTLDNPQSFDYPTVVEITTKNGIYVRGFGAWELPPLKDGVPPSSFVIPGASQVSTTSTDEAISTSSFFPGRGIYGANDGSTQGSIDMITLDGRLGGISETRTTQICLASIGIADNDASPAVSAAQTQTTQFWTSNHTNYTNVVVGGIFIPGGVFRNYSSVNGNAERQLAVCVKAYHEDGPNTGNVRVSTTVDTSTASATSNASVWISSEDVAGNMNGTIMTVNAPITDCILHVQAKAPDSSHNTVVQQVVVWEHEKISTL